MADADLKLLAGLFHLRRLLLDLEDVPDSDDERPVSKLLFCGAGFRHLRSLPCLQRIELNASLHCDEFDVILSMSALRELRCVRNQHRPRDFEAYLRSAPMDDHRIELHGDIAVVACPAASSPDWYVWDPASKKPATSTIFEVFRFRPKAFCQELEDLDELATDPNYEDQIFL